MNVTTSFSCDKELLSSIDASWAHGLGSVLICLRRRPPLERKYRYLTLPEVKVFSLVLSTDPVDRVNFLLDGYELSDWIADDLTVTDIEDRKVIELSDSDHGPFSCTLTLPDSRALSSWLNKQLRNYPNV